MDQISDRKIHCYFIYLTMAELGRHFLLPMLPLLYFHKHWLWSYDASFAMQAWSLGMGLALVKGGGIMACGLAYWVLSRLGPWWAAWLSHLSVVVIALLGMLAMIQHQVAWLQLGLFLHGLLFCGEVSGLSYAQHSASDASGQLKRLACFQSYWCFGAMLGPLVAVLLLDSNQWFWFLWKGVLSMGILGSILGVFFFPQPNNQKAISLSKVRFDKQTMSTVWPLLILLWLVQLAWAMFYQFSPAFLVRYLGFCAQGVGFSMAGLSMVLVFTSGWLLPRLEARLGVQQSIRFALWGLALSSLFSLLQTHWGWWALSATLIAMADVILFTLLLRALITAWSGNGIAVVCLVFLSCLVLWMICDVIGGYGFAWHPWFMGGWVASLSLMALYWSRARIRR